MKRCRSIGSAGTSASVIRRLQQDTARALAQADVRARFTDIGVAAAATSPDEFAALIKSDIPRWAKVFAAAGIKAASGRLKAMKFPVTSKALGEAPRDLNDAVILELARWIDALDRI